MTHVLLTRPLPASQQLAGQLDGLGLIPVVMPLYTFSSRDPQIVMGSCWSQDGRKLAVFTSPRSVQFGLPHISAEQRPELELAVVGSATRRKLESEGYEVQLQSKTGYTSEDFLQLPDLTHNPGEAVIFCAPGGRDTIATGLISLGWKVTNAMVYERVSLQPSTGQLNELDRAQGLISTWTSISAVDLAHEHLPAGLWKKILKAPALVISSRIQQHFQQLGAVDVQLSEGPGNQDLLRSIERLSGLQNQN